MNLNETTLSQEYIFNGKIINLRKDEALLPDGSVARREVIEHNGGVCVVPITDNGEIITVKQFRYPYKEVIREIPAGKRDSRDELPLECGIRELKEETGCTAKKMIFLGELYPSPGYCAEIIYMYAAVGLEYGETDPDDDEFLETEKIPLSQLIDDVLSGKIKDAKTQTALLKVNELIKRGEL